MVNVALLQEAMKRQSITPEQAAEAMGIDRSTFYRRISQADAKFTVEEVSKLSAMLHLSAQAMQEFFFDRQLA